MIKKILLIVCVLSTLLSFSQAIELDDITIEMLESSKSVIDSSAAAEVLYEKGSVSFLLTDTGWEYIFEMTRRIKIFNKDGYDEANIELPYYVGESNSVKESVKKIDARTYFLEDGKVEDEKVRNKEIYDIELSDVVKAKKFTFPKIQDGVIIEYTYTEESPNIRNLPRWYFQSNIPTVYSEFETTIPIEYLAYRSQYRGYYNVETIKDQYNGFITAMGEIQISRTKHISKNLQAIESENHVNNISNYITSVFYELSAYRKNSMGQMEFLTSNWQDVIKNLKETETFTKELQRTNYFEEDLAQAISGGGSSEIEKVTSILEFVKQKIKWNKDTRLYCSDNLKRVYNEGIGNSSDINIMLTAMLRAANIDANPIVSSTISMGIPMFPTVSGFNYVLCGVRVEDQYFLLDATDTFSSLNLLPERTMNWEGIELTPTASKTIQLVPKKQSKINFNVFAKIQENGKVSGQCRVYYFDQHALNARNAFGNTSEEKVRSLYEKEYKLTNVHDFSQTNFEILNKPLVQTFKFDETEGFVEKIGNKLYVSPLIFLKSDENPFKSKERNYPIDYTYPKKYTYRLIIDLPEGYTVDYIPEKNIYKMVDDMLVFTYMIQHDNGKIVVDVTKEINAAVIPPFNYSDLREYYISMLDKENEKVVLVKP